MRDYVADEELAALYARPRAFAFLSEYEGFGLTPLEALAAGVPLVVLDTPVAREVYGDAAAYVPRRRHRRRPPPRCAAADDPSAAPTRRSRARRRVARALFVGRRG